MYRLAECLLSVIELTLFEELLPELNFPLCPTRVSVVAAPEQTQGQQYRK